MSFTDEDFRLFTKALADVFEVNHINDLQLWGWRNEGDVMRAWRYTPAPEDCQCMTPLHNGKEEFFSVFAHRSDDGDICYTFGLAGFQYMSFDSLELLIGAMTGVVKSLKLSSKFLGEVA